jgi:hypothetical protein
MLNSVNLNEELNNSQLSEQNSVSSVVTNPINNNPYQNSDKNLLIDETAISNEAITLYQKDQDISNFNKIAMSDPQDLSHEEIIANLFSNGVSDPLSDEAAEGLSTNQKLLNDLSL